MRNDPRVVVNVDQELIALAAKALGIDERNISEITRAALAQVAGVDVRDYTPRRGRPPINKREAA